MASISGILDTSLGSARTELVTRVQAMVAQAPACGVTVIEADETTGIALVVAGAPEEANPIHLSSLAESESGRFLIAMTGANGPFTTMRNRIKREGSNSNLIAASIELVGMALTLALCDGPLALAVWDRAERTLSIGRDRFGQESLFAAWAGSSFIFGSHLFSLLAHPQFRRDIDPGSIAQYLRFSTFHSPATVFSDVVRVSPGSMMTIRPDRPGATIQQIPVATVREDAEYGLGHRFAGSFADATNALEHALQTSVRESTADPSAPLGIFFSGGLDSTLIAAVASSLNERPVHAITAGFDEAGYDESGHARAIARHLKVEHHVLPFTADHMRDLLPQMPEMFQEPFGDLAAYPSIHLAREIGKHARVVMTGDGGDELFMGKPRDFALWRLRQKLPRSLQQATGFGLDLLAFGAEQARPLIDRRAPGAIARYLRPTRIKKAAVGMHARTSEELIAAIFCDTLDPGEIVRNVQSEPPTHYHNHDRWLPTDDQNERWRFAVFQSYTLEREVPKHGRSIAAGGAIYRGIFLHPAVTSLAWSFPPELRDHNDVSRALIKNVINRSIPPEIYARDKAGFNVPFDRWLRGPLRDMAEELLSAHRLEQDGIFNVAPITRELRQHMSGKYDRRFILFDLISFQLWLESMQRVPVAL